MSEPKKTESFAGNVMKYSIATYLGFGISGAALIIKGVLPAESYAVPASFMAYTMSLMNVCRLWSSPSIPVCDFGKAFRDAVRRVHVQYGQIAGHLYQHAQNAVLGKVVQEGSIGGVFHLAARIEDQPGGGRFRRKDSVAVLLGDAHHVIRYQRILGGGVCVVVVADVNAERNIDGQQNSQQAEEHSEGKRFFLLVLHRTPLFYKHFPQSLQPLQINLLPQVSQLARKWGT